jgi:Zn-dependent protease with chaperone function
VRVTQLPFFVRAVVAVALLASVYVVVAALMGGLLLVDVATLSHPSPLTPKLLIVTVGAAAAVVSALRKVRVEDPQIVGVPVSHEAEPRLWQVVNATAAATGTHPPTELWLVPEANAGVLEHRRRGRPTRRIALLGIPLLAGLSEAELRSVIGHEMAHYSGSDTRLSPVVYRGTLAVRHLAAAVGSRAFLGPLLRGYGGLYLRIATAINRRQELTADALAARIAGSEPAIAALQKVENLDRAWDYYASGFLAPAMNLGKVPQGTLTNLTTLIAGPRAADHPLDAPHSSPEPGPLDSHPPLSARIAALRAAPVATPSAVGTGPATDLLTSRGRVEQEVDSLFCHLAGGAALEPWDDVAPLLAPAFATGPAGALVAAVEHVRGAAPSTLRDVLLEAARDPIRLGVELANGRTPENSQEASALVEHVHSALRALMALALVSSGQARWTASLVDRPYRVAAPAGVVDLKAFVDTLLACPDQAALDAWFTSLRIDPSYRPEQVRAVDPVHDRFLACATRVPHRMRRLDVLVRTDGIALVRSKRVRRGQGSRVDELRALTPETLGPQDVWIPRSQLESARLRANGVGSFIQRQWHLTLRLVGRRKKVKLTIEHGEQAQILANGLHALLGERFRTR